nr:type I phosphomannose isomerase catalytic subunit [Maliibacterium massiliense]
MSACYTRPLKLVPNKIVRYPGGREIDRFRGVEPAKDDGRPEAWVGSCTTVRNAANSPDPHDGMAKVTLPDGSTPYLKDFIQTDAENLLGKKHFARYGSNTNLLVKLLDAEKQLRLQAHPTRAHAKEAFGQDFGKAECWYIVSLRDDSPVKPYVLMGFKEGIKREIFDELYDQEDVPAMENWCHKVFVKPGDMFNIPGGLIHAVGTGCFLIELQEPSDLVVGVTKNPELSGKAAEDWKELQLGTYHYEGHSYEENLRINQVPPRVLREDAGGKETYLIGSAQTPYFSAALYEVMGAFKPMDTGTFSIAIVLEGAGSINYAGGELPIKRGDELFLPAGIADMELLASSALKIIRCFPPDVL